MFPDCKDPDGDLRGNYFLRVINFKVAEGFLS